MLYTMVLAGIPIGVAYAQDAPITVAINTALGSAPIDCANCNPIGTNSAVAAVLDIKFVNTADKIKITAITIYGLGLLPNNPMIVFATTEPAPVFTRAVAIDKEPTNKNIVFISMDFTASVSVTTFVATKISAPIHADTYSLTPI